MAKSRSRSRSYRRDYHYPITRRSLPIRRAKKPLPNLTHYEDRRLWHPENNNAPAKSFNRSRHRLIVPKRNNRSVSAPSYSLHHLFEALPVTIGFEAPKKVLVCVRRKVRKEILFALNKTGKRGQKRPRWNEYSHVQC